MNPKTIWNSLKALCYDNQQPPWKHIALAALIVLVGLLVLPRDATSIEARRAVGGALLSIGLVGVLYDYFFVRRTIGGYFELLKTAAEIGLDHIYNNRAEALKDIASEIQKAYGSVKIAAISGSDFFGQGATAHALTTLVQRKHDVHIRVLLLDVRSLFAKLRAWIEEIYNVAREDQEKLDDRELSPKYSKADFVASAMYFRIENAKRCLQKLGQMAKSPTKVSARFYRYQPSLFIVAVNNWIFVESYHWGVDPTFTPDPFEPCIAKNVIVMKFSRGSSNGVTLENHFDRMWQCKQSKRFLPGPQVRSNLQVRVAVQDPANALNENAKTAQSRAPEQASGATKRKPSVSADSDCTPNQASVAG